jgi:uncharacterized protein (TIGR02453 family)
MLTAIETATMTTRFDGFPPETMKFLRRLRKNNNREWFQANKQAYERDVKAPMLEIVTVLGDALQAFAPEMVIDPKKVMYRIYRDTRFSADKTPYKTHVAALFYPRSLSKGNSAALYFHLEPAEVLIAGGIYMPGPAELRAIRMHISAHWDEFKRIVENREFVKEFGGLQGEKLTRVPQGFPADHPGIGYLKHKQYIVWFTEPPAFAESAQLLPRILRAFATMIPFVRFLNAPLLRAGRLI